MINFLKSSIYPNITFFISNIVLDFQSCKDVNNFNFQIYTIFLKYSNMFLCFELLCEYILIQGSPVRRLVLPFLVYTSSVTNKNIILNIKLCLLDVALFGCPSGLNFNLEKLVRPSCLNNVSTNYKFSGSVKSKLLVSKFVLGFFIVPT